MEYWHNPRCSKSREALALLRQHGVQPQIRAYLTDPPSLDALKTVIAALGLPGARALMRTREKRYAELGLKDVSDEGKLMAAMAANPQLIERPVLINGARAALGRPPERILDAL